MHDGTQLKPIFQALQLVWPLLLGAKDKRIN